ncbi:TPA: 5-methyltetrahydropteroyltriglutamate--homocysteine S-methyltransferase [Photobacterium damselae]
MTINKTKTHILGFPRIGKKRELKFALEKYWRQEISQFELLDVGSKIRIENWQLQQQTGLDFATVGDFAWYDHVLGTSLLLGHIPKRHQHGFPTLDTLFGIARGKTATGCGCAAGDMTKWFNTNYHYIVPEFSADDRFTVSWPQLFEEVAQAQAAGHQVKPVLLGPLSYLWLGTEKDEDPNFDRLSLLPRLIAAYQHILSKLKALGVEWVQIDEPILSLELPTNWIHSFKLTYQMLHGYSKLLLATYFDDVTSQLDKIVTLNVDGIHIDAVSSPSQLSQVANAIPNHWVLSAGVINGRNVWRADLASWLEVLTPIKALLGERLWLASSCSLLHSPIELSQESKLNPEVKQWFAFAHEKCHELSLLARALDGEDEAEVQCRTYSEVIHSRQKNTKVNNSEVQQRVNNTDFSNSSRAVSFSQRKVLQQNKLQLPLYPTTTIGSFPQTGEIRTQRRDFKAGRLDKTSYDAAMKAQIRDAIARQERLGLDVLVHGEAERNDMVEYFAEHLAGFVSTQFGWVQSYGSRCVKPAIVVSDIYRSQPITLEWASYAQSLTDKPVKGMLTGPVTILAWTFPREDISKQEIANQIALALRDEVDDLQQQGIAIIQIDEPALREGLPLKESQWEAYLTWAVNAFKVAAGSAKPETQIHTHMCYSEFNHIISAVADLDADVITIETSRSDMALLGAFEAFNYPNDIGPGVYDIHSPNIPSKQAIIDLLTKAERWIEPQKLWVNPDCGLKTRNWQECEAALEVLVDAAKELRLRYHQTMLHTT